MAGKRKKKAADDKPEEMTATLQEEENEETEEEEKEGEGESQEPVEPQEPEEEEKELADVLYEAFLQLEDEKNKLDEEKERLNKAADEIRTIIYAPIQKDAKGVVVPPDEFVHTDAFLKKLDVISEFVGQALDYVIRLEKLRKKYNFPMGETPEQMTGVPEDEETPSSQPNNQQQPINVTVAQPQRPVKGGFFDWRIAKLQLKMQEEKLEAEAAGNKQPVTAAERVGDVLEFGRQLIPAINRVKAWFPGVLAGFKFFTSEHRYFIRHQELQTFLGQTLGTLSSFVSAYVEYKKSVIDGRKVSLTKSFARIVEAQGGAGTSVQYGGTFMRKGAELGPHGFQERK
jgi:hypothetical protein